jgi:hypothetical protein
MRLTDRTEQKPRATCPASTSAVSDRTIVAASIKPPCSATCAAMQSWQCAPSCAVVACRWATSTDMNNSSTQQSARTRSRPNLEIGCWFRMTHTWKVKKISSRLLRGV